LEEEIAEGDGRHAFPVQRFDLRVWLRYYSPLHIPFLHFPEQHSPFTTHGAFFGQQPPSVVVVVLVVVVTVVLVVVGGGTIVVVVLPEGYRNVMPSSSS
jgi:hypothetical protein